MEFSERRRYHRQRRRRQRLAFLLAAAVAAGGTAAVAGFGPYGAEGQAHSAYAGGKLAPHRTHWRRPAQFIVVSFDGSGGAKLWPYWRWIGRRAHARFTFFVSGVYLLDEARRMLYRPPRHEPGRSDIGFAQAEGSLSAQAIVRRMLGQMTLAYRTDTRSERTTMRTPRAAPIRSLGSGRRTHLVPPGKSADAQQRARPPRLPLRPEPGRRSG